MKAFLALFCLTSIVVAKANAQIRVGNEWLRLFQEGYVQEAAQALAQQASRQQPLERNSLIRQLARMGYTVEQLDSVTKSQYGSVSKSTAEVLKHLTDIKMGMGGNKQIFESVGYGETRTVELDKRVNASILRQYVGLESLVTRFIYAQGTGAQAMIVNEAIAQYGENLRILTLDQVSTMNTMKSGKDFFMREAKAEPSKITKPELRRMVEQKGRLGTEVRPKAVVEIIEGRK